ncbi:MAG: hypothetical protein R3C61_08145 [Bacteroidia bacterium]
MDSKMKKIFRTEINLLLIIVAGFFPLLVKAQFQCKDTVLIYFSSDRSIIIDKDTIPLFTSRVKRVCLDEISFIEIANFSDTADGRIDTFQVRNGKWFRKFHGKFRLYFSVEKFHKGKTTKICYVEGDLFDVRGGKDITVCHKMIPRSITSSGVYVFEIYDPLIRRTYEMYFDPSLGIIKINNMSLRNQSY